MLQQYTQRISIHPSDSTYVLLVYCYIMFNSTKFSATFLAIVLLTGTIATISPSFIVGAQAQQEYNGIDNRYNSYEPTEYPPEYTDNNSYEPTEYPPEYTDNNSYEREYTSYTPDYKPQYPSYEKDDRDKSKDSSSKSISINKLKCINNNVNINGNNNGTINVGNSGSSATGSGTDQGYLGVGSYGDNGEGYNKGYNKQKDQGFTCIINNNNNNTIVTGNVTDGNEAETQPCEDCILDSLSPEQEIDLEEAIQFLTDLPDLESLCEYLADETILPLNKYDTLTQILFRAEVPSDTIDDILDCLRALGFDIFDPPGLSSSPTPTRLGLSNLPTIAQGTEDLTALEKITKLKTQW